MRAILFGTFILGILLPVAAQGFYQFKAVDISGKEHGMDEFRGKVVLVVNTASRCGFTPQYKGLEALYEKYKDRGLVILGFPSNDFLGQEPGTNEEIKAFCDLNYKVSFPLYSKVDVTGGDAHPLFRWLADKKANPVFGAEPGWNFTKYLVGKDGKLVGRFDSAVTPESAELVKAVEKYL